MQLLYGPFPIIRGKGFAAKAVADMLEEMGSELGSEAVEVESKFDELILIDREVRTTGTAALSLLFSFASMTASRPQVDLITPMVTPLTVYLSRSDAFRYRQWPHCTLSRG